MGSSDSYGGSSKSYARYENLRSTKTEDRVKGWTDHREVVREAVAKIDRGEIAPPVQRDVAAVYEPSLAKNSITRPSASARRAVVVLVDNSGSNEAIATKLRDSSGYFTAFMRTVDPLAEVAFVYFSDHEDRGPRGQSTMLQYTDFIPPTETGDKILLSSLKNVVAAHGDDEPEAIECALSTAAEIDFAHIPKANRTLVLITDSVAHGMGFPGDSGCPHQKSWRASMAEVRDTFGNFVMIGSGSNRQMRTYQQKFFETTPGVVDESDMALNFIDFSDIKSSVHRQGLVGNAILFCMARNAGKQAVQIFLAGLYAKWLKNPIFGQNTAAFAKDRIGSFARLYLGNVMDKSEVETLLLDIFAE